MTHIVWVKLLNKVKQIKGLKNYGIVKELRNRGVDITIPGVDHYDKTSARSMRLEVLCGLREIAGVSWNEFGKWLDEEFWDKSKPQRKRNANTDK